MCLFRPKLINFNSDQNSNEIHFQCIFFTTQIHHKFFDPPRDEIVVFMQESSCSEKIQQILKSSFIAFGWAALVESWISKKRTEPCSLSRVEYALSVSAYITLLNRRVMYGVSGAADITFLHNPRSMVDITQKTEIFLRPIILKGGV